ncbi:acetyl-CoA carboxylase biotin carboxyl carrier protein [Clostridium polynesiense]|uniref:acetyl-CoA carboxylase biotin carboxyl carrier protein n=1 Tax=Clostridium polynesiense TaxID=1325933 RepID=UPI00058D4D39|nr:acetyl-CoA carboxylase biotin carboxyl carrier protein [Clostridium polynesiense]
MTFEELKEIVKLIDSSEISLFEYEAKGISLRLDKSINRTGERNRVNEEDTLNHNLSPSDFKINDASDKNIENNEKIEQWEIVKSPIVGTFYSSPAPDKEAFCSISQKVSKGDVLCIIEAMKLMNEIESPYDGEIIDVLVEDGSTVEYGEPLFKIRKQV